MMWHILRPHHRVVVVRALARCIDVDVDWDSFLLLQGPLWLSCEKVQERRHISYNDVSKRQIARVCKCEGAKLEVEQQCATKGWRGERLMMSLQTKNNNNGKAMYD
jgi:hypothetical protein